MLLMRTVEQWASMHFVQVRWMAELTHAKLVEHYRKLTTFSKQSKSIRMIAIGHSYARTVAYY